MASEFRGRFSGPYTQEEEAEGLLTIERSKGCYFWRRLLVPEDERSPYSTLANLEREYHQLVDEKLAGRGEPDVDGRLQQVSLMLEYLCPESVLQNEQALQLAKEEEAKYRAVTGIKNLLEAVVRKVEGYVGKRDHNS